MSHSATQHILHLLWNPRVHTMFTIVTGSYNKPGQFNAQHNLSWSTITENFSTFFKTVLTFLTFCKFPLLADSYIEDTKSQSIQVQYFPIIWDSYKISCKLVTCSEVTFMQMNKHELLAYWYYVHQRTHAHTHTRVHINICT